MKKPHLRFQRLRLGHSPGLAFGFASSLGRGHAPGGSLASPAGPRPILDIDRTILIHQAEASRLRHGADVVFLGDSSCLMDFSAKDLEGWLPPDHRVLNLATLSYVDLPACAGLLRNYVAANPDRLRVVVLLLHPEMPVGLNPSRNTSLGCKVL